MKLKETDFNLIKINFEFRNQIVIIKAEPYKIFQDIKYLALNKFIDIFITIPNNLHFYYRGKDLINQEQEKIGNLFNHKEQITISLRLPKIKLNTKLSNDKNNLSLNDKYIINKDNISIDNNFLLEKTLYNNKNKTNKSYYNLKSNNVNTNPINKINKNLLKSNSMPHMPYINSETKNPPKNNNKFNFELDFNDLGNFAFCDKHKYKVSEYCRTCKKFICQQCLLNQLHKDHLTIQLNLQNLEESIKLYIMLLQTNEKNNIKRIKESQNQENDDLIDIDILSQKENDMMQKFDIIINNYHSFMRKIEKKIGVDKKKYRIMVINNFNDVAMRISMQINAILNKFDVAIKKKDTNFSFEDLQYYLDEISKKEQTLELIRERTIKYLLTFEINNKVETTFDKIEATLDSINDKENPFNLDKKYNKELIKILGSRTNFNTNVINNEQYNNNKPNKGILKKRDKRRNGLISNS